MSNFAIEAGLRTPVMNCVWNEGGGGVAVTDLVVAEKVQDVRVRDGTIACGFNMHLHIAILLFCECKNNLNQQRARGQNNLNQHKARDVLLSRASSNSDSDMEVGRVRTLSWVSGTRRLAAPSEFANSSGCLRFQWRCAA